MPYITVTTNLTLDADKTAALKAKIAQMQAKQ